MPKNENNVVKRNKMGLTSQEQKKWTKQTLGLVFSLSNCMAGSVVLTLPSVFANTGYLIAAIYMAISIFFSLWSYHVLIKACYYTNSISVYQLVMRSYGKSFAIFCDVALACAIFGYLCSYISVSADYLHQGIADIAKFVDPEHVILQEDYWPKIFRVIVAFVIMFPLSLLRTLDSLSTISSFAVIFFLVAAIGVCYYFGLYAKNDMKVINFIPNHPIERDPEIHILPEKEYIPNILAYFSLFFSLYTLHVNIPPIIGELKGPYETRKKSIWIASLSAVIFVAVFYILVGVFGSLMFDRDCSTEDKEIGKCWPLDSNVLKSFVGVLPMTIIKLLYALVIFLSYPVMLHPCRVTILGWFKAPSKFTKRGYGFHVLTGLVITIVAVLLSVFIPSIDDALSIFCSVFGTVTFEVFPLMVRLKLPMLKKYYERCIKDKLEAPENLNEKNTNLGAADISYVNFNFDTSMIIPNSNRQSISEKVSLEKAVDKNKSRLSNENLIEHENTDIESHDHDNCEERSNESVKDIKEVNKEDLDDNNNNNEEPVENAEESSASSLDFVSDIKNEVKKNIDINMKKKIDDITERLERNPVAASDTIRRSSVLQRLSCNQNSRPSTLAVTTRVSLDRRGSFSLFSGNNAEIGDSTMRKSNSIIRDAENPVNTNNRRSSIIAEIISTDRDRAQSMIEDNGIIISPDKENMTEEEWLSHQNEKMRLAAELNEADEEAARELEKDIKKQDERIIKNTFIPSIGKYRGKRSYYIGMWFVTAIFIAINAVSISCQLYLMAK